MYYKLKANDSTGKAHVFSIEDAPVLITKKQLILRNKPMSPILQVSTLRRCFGLTSCEGEHLAEHDVIRIGDSKRLYTIKYINGFYAVGGDETIPIIKCHPIHLHGYNEQRTVPTCPALYYSYKGIAFNIKSIIGCDNEQLYLNRRDIPFIPLNDVKQLFLHANKEYCLDDEILLADGRKGTVCLHYGQLAIYVDGEYLMFKTNINLFKNNYTKKPYIRKNNI